jgi:hypothetical protein
VIVVKALLLEMALVWRVERSGMVVVPRQIHRCHRTLSVLVTEFVMWSGRQPGALILSKGARPDGVISVA